MSPARAPSCPAATQRPSGEMPYDLPPAAELERPLLAAVEPAHDDVEVDAVAAVRDIREQRTVAADVRRTMDEARIDDERLELCAGLRVEQVQLRPLVPALVDLEQDPAVRQQPARDGLAQVGQLRQPAAPHPREEELAGSGQVGVDEQRFAVAGERERRGLPQLEEGPQFDHPVRAIG